MFGRSDKDSQHVDFSLLKTDLHSHLIPGIDDGSPDLETSVFLIRQMAQLGFSKLITTPHIMWDMYKNSKQDILNGLDQLREAIEKENLEVELSAAAEYYLDNHVRELLSEGEKLLTLDDRRVLVEFSLADHSYEVNEILFEMQIQGYQPVIAHPERYIYPEKGRDFFHELKDSGYELQLNILSLSGLYGKEIQKNAAYIADKGFYDFAATDLHNIRHLEALRNPSLIQQITKIALGNSLLNQQL